MNDLIKNAANLDELLDAARDQQLNAADILLDVKEIVRLASCSERTVRRYISRGMLTSASVEDQNRHVFTLDAVAGVFGRRRDVIARAKTSPMDELNETIKRLSAQVEEQSALIEQLKHEQRDARAQLYQLHEQLVKALPPPAKPSLLDRLFKRKSV